MYRSGGSCKKLHLVLEDSTLECREVEGTGKTSPSPRGQYTRVYRGEGYKLGK